MLLLSWQPGALLEASNSSAQASTSVAASALVSWIRCSSSQWVTRKAAAVDVVHATDIGSTCRNPLFHFRFGIKA